MSEIIASYLVRIQVRPAEAKAQVDAPTLTELVDAITEKLASIVPGATISATAERLDE